MSEYSYLFRHKKSLTKGTSNSHFFSKECVSKEPPLKSTLNCRKTTIPHSRSIHKCYQPLKTSNDSSRLTQRWSLSKLVVAHYCCRRT